MEKRKEMQVRFGPRIGHGLCADKVPTEAARDAVAKLQSPAKTTSRTATKDQTR